MIKQLKENHKYIITGLLAGIPNGFFGAGGGMILVPLFCRWMNLPEKKAFATSVAVILPMCIVSAIIYLIRQDFSFMDAVPFLLGGLIGGLLSGIIFRKISTNVLHKALGLFIIYGGIRSVFF